MAAWTRRRAWHTVTAHRCLMFLGLGAIRVGVGMDGQIHKGLPAQHGTRRSASRGGSRAAKGRMRDAESPRRPHQISAKAKMWASYPYLLATGFHGVAGR